MNDLKQKGNGQKRERERSGTVNKKIGTGIVMETVRNANRKRKEQESLGTGTETKRNWYGEVVLGGK